MRIETSKSAVKYASFTLGQRGTFSQEHKMIESLEIQNFRGIERLQLKNLRRINLVVGPNASGKTALLEGLFVGSGATPELVLRTKQWRGMPGFGIAALRAVYEDLWRDLFFQFDQKRDILISLKGSSPLCTRSLRITYNSPQEVLIPVPSSTSIADGSPIVPIAFEWTDGVGKKTTGIPLVNASGLGIKSEGDAALMPSAFYSSANTPPASETATYFSNFSIRNAQDSIVKSLRQEFPYIKEITSESRAVGSVVYVSLEHLSEKIPINLLSSGINKLLTLLLGIANQPGGVVYIDEIENGFYYDRMPSIWRLILQFSRDFDVQIFASTHSKECLEAASECAKANSEDFCLLRTSRINGKSVIRQFTGKGFHSAIEMGGEIRSV